MKWKVKMFGKEEQIRKLKAQLENLTAEHTKLQDRCREVETKLAKYKTMEQAIDAGKHACGVFCAGCAHAIEKNERVPGTRYVEKYACRLDCNCKDFLSNEKM